MKYEIDKKRCVQESQSADSPEERTLPVKGKFVHKVQKNKEIKFSKDGRNYSSHHAIKI